MMHLPERDRALLGYPTRQETLALVGWMALANMFGEVSRDEVSLREPLPPQSAAYWIGDISKVVARRAAISSPSSYRQSVPANRVRQVRVTKAVGALA